MRLRRLVIQGYKSFATRSEFVFDGGITAIVGPNGSGKSNIADALRWVLGEQSYGVLRSRRTTDLIFAGTDGRGRLGMAEASIILDNSDNSLPIDYQEVAITRRAYRSGENEYYINGSRARLRDIGELLGHGGLNRLTYTVIGQGMIDAALSLSPTERRKLFEEAAGITPYQSKRDEALRRLDETASNVLRVHDIMRELEPQLQRLATQAEQARRLADLQGELQSLQMQYYGRRLAEAEEQASAAGERATYLELRLGQQLAELSAFERSAEQLQAAEKALSARIESWQREAERLSGALATSERQQAVLHERERSLRQRLAELAEEEDTLAAEQQELTQEESAACSDIARLEGERQALTEELKALEAAEAGELELRQRGEQHLKQARQELEQALAAASGALSKLQAAERRRSDLQQQLAEVEEQLRRSQARLDEYAAACEAAALRVQAVQQRLRQAQALQEEQHLAAQQAQAALADLRRQAAAAEEEEQRLRARLAMLARMQQESYYPGVRAVLSLAEREPEAGGIIGTVGSVLKVPAELEDAIEAVLGGRLQQVVVQRWRDAERAIIHLKRQQAGRVTFLPLETIRPPRPVEVPRRTGVLGVASEMVAIAPGLESILQYLLNRTVIVRDLATARLLLDEVKGSYTIATLEGEVAQSSGSVTGGGDRRSKSTILEYEREARSLAPQLQAAGQRRQAAIDGEQRQRQLAASAEVEAAAADRLLQQERAALEEAQRQETRARLELQQAQDSHQWHLQRLAGFRKEYESIAQALAAMQAEAQAAQLQADERRRQVQVLEADLLKRSVETSNSLQAGRSRLASLDERIASLASARLAARQRLQRLHQRTAERQAQRLAVESQIAEAVAQLQDATSAADEYRRALLQVQESIGPAKAELSALQRRREALEREQRLRRQWHLEFSHRCGEAKNDAARAQDTVVALEEAARRELGDGADPTALRALLRENQAAEPAERIAERIEEVRRRCRHVGSVNPNAPQEHAALLERYTFLSTQAEDLERAAASLRHVISELEHTMQQRFSATFAAVASHFSGYFEELFAGGHARLSLTDPDDLANSGIEITVRPPGKRSQDLALLSGGERALTSCALLFSLLEASQTPFCLVDEVDAMLDEANVGRFRRVLQSLSQKTQFIVISHNRQTIEAADTIYGITMADDGTSRALSLRLSDAMAMAKASG